MSGQLKKSFVEDVASNWHMAYHTYRDRKKKKSGGGKKGQEGAMGAESQVCLKQVPYSRSAWQGWRDVILHHMMHNGAFFML